MAQLVDGDDYESMLQPLVVPPESFSSPLRPVAGLPLSEVSPVSPEAEGKEENVSLLPPVEVRTSMRRPVKRSDQRTQSWRVRYELGAGDTLTFGLQGRPEVTRSNVVIPPDGKVSFMQARQVSAAGKTIDELRAALEARLAEFQKDPVAIVTPVALSSKQFSVLGEVRNSGNYPLTRHTTLLEALSLAGGFNLGLLETGNNVFEVADLKRSFVSRNGIKLGVDLEALYLRGDFSQNIQLEPGDYIHIASLEENQVFVLGRVNRPGAYPARPGVTALGAIAESGGFSQGAWRNRVLVVRGKLSDPTLHVVQLNKTIRGKNSDFSLEPGDLVYVSLRPWAYATQILDAALAAYIDGSVTGLLANDDVGFSFGPGF